MAIDKTTFIEYQSTISANFLNTFQDAIIAEFAKKVDVDTAQTFVDSQKARARSNIDAVGTDEVTAAVNNAMILEVSMNSGNAFNSLPQTAYDERLTDEYVLVNWELSNPSAQTGDWTVSTANGTQGGNGSVTVSGTIGSATTMKLYLAKKQSASS